MVVTKKETTAKKNIQATCFEIHIALLNRFQTKYLGLSEQSHGSIQEDVKSANLRHVEGITGNRARPGEIFEMTQMTQQHTDEPKTCV